eukprot:TRINITY_DN27912_c0_g1_i1.p1 TRINITY_DN27912_c0_g1~~TRINITY_DN27912_c0_g1_i1.p1  ORF type:complete len:276 (+),score=63.57 TRINITY_DN27912_c0_g1_i1:69-830(+)
MDEKDEFRLRTPASPVVVLDVEFMRCLRKLDEVPPLPPLPNLIPLPLETTDGWSEGTPQSGGCLVCGGRGCSICTKAEGRAPKGCLSCGGAGCSLCSLCREEGHSASGESELWDPKVDVAPKSGSAGERLEADCVDALPGALLPPPQIAPNEKESPERSIDVLDVSSGAESEEDTDSEKEDGQQQEKRRRRGRGSDEEAGDKEEESQGEEDTAALQEVRKIGLILLYVLLAAVIKAILIIGALLYLLPHRDPS